MVSSQYSTLHDLQKLFEGKGTSLQDETLYETIFGKIPDITKRLSPSFTRISYTNPAFVL